MQWHICVSLFLAVRGGDWHLHMASIKKMAPVFTAFDHATYQKVISQHIADILVMPDSILTMFQRGAFVVSISGREWHSVAIDEAHEMSINRGCKSSLVKPHLTTSIAWQVIFRIDLKSWKI